MGSEAATDAWRLGVDKGICRVPQAAVWKPKKGHIAPVPDAVGRELVACNSGKLTQTVRQVRIEVPRCSILKKPGHNQYGAATIDECRSARDRSQWTCTRIFTSAWMQHFRHTLTQAFTVAQCGTCTQVGILWKRDEKNCRACFGHQSSSALHLP
jgi:hypothetical protein